MGSRHALKCGPELLILFQQPFIFPGQPFVFFSPMVDFRHKTFNFNNQTCCHCALRK